MLTGNGNSLSFLPSPLGVHAVGTKRSGGRSLEASASTFTSSVSTVRQPLLERNAMVYCVVLL